MSVLALDFIATHPRLTLLLVWTLVILGFWRLFKAISRDDRRTAFDDEIATVQQEHERAYGRHLADINDYRKRGVR